MNAGLTANGVSLQALWCDFDTGQSPTEVAYSLQTKLDIKMCPDLLAFPDRIRSEKVDTRGSVG